GLGRGGAAARRIASIAARPPRGLCVQGACGPEARHHLGDDVVLDFVAAGEDRKLPVIEVGRRDGRGIVGSDADSVVAALEDKLDILANNAGAAWGAPLADFP